jgi:hypothetical protein
MNEGMAFTLVFLAQSVPWAGTNWAGTAAIVVLAVASLIVGAIVIEKLHKLSVTRRNSLVYAREINPLFKERKWAEAIEVTSKRAKTSHIAKIAMAGFEERRRLPASLTSSQVARHMQQAMEREFLKLQADYESGLGILDALGRTAPFIGALGGSAVTFTFGIALAIPTIWFLANLRNKTTVRLAVEMKLVMNELICFVELELGKSF